MALRKHSVHCFRKFKGLQLTFQLPFRTLIREIAGILISAKSDSYAISALMSAVLLFLL
jgi:hypothetical protein